MTPLHIPKRLKIGKSTWIIKKSNHNLNIKKYMGMCFYDTKVILLDGTLPRNELEDTYIHELLHAIFPRGICNNKKEEALIEAMSRPLLNIINSIRLHDERKCKNKAARNNKNNKRHKKIKKSK